MGTLETTVMESPISLGQELKQSIRNYPRTWKEYFKTLAPAIVISSIGSAAGQWAATQYGYDSKLATTAAAYVGGYIPGYLVFFGLEYHRHRDKYPRLFSKQFGEFMGTFLAADYVADLSTFTPAFIASNLWLTDHTTLNPALRGVVAWDAAALLYVTSISALHPLTRRINAAINTSVKSAYRRIKGAFSSTAPSAH